MSRRSPDLKTALEAMVPMAVEVMVEQPAEVWLRVEEMINHGWHFAAAATVRYTDGAAGAVSPGSGWLKPSYIAGLTARSVPVGEMFTLAALERRPRG